MKNEEAESKIELKTKRNDTKINNYNKLMLLGWKGNVDI